MESIEKYNVEAPFVKRSLDIQQVKIMLKQHVGNAAEPTVKYGDYVKEGDLIADIQNDQLGAKIHASISGTVNKINDEFIEIIK